MELGKVFTKDVSDEIDLEGQVESELEDRENILAKGNDIRKNPDLEELKER